MYVCVCRRMLWPVLCLVLWQWTAEEDRVLLRLVAQSGARDWGGKAAVMGRGRSASSVRKRERESQL